MDKTSGVLPAIDLEDDGRHGLRWRIVLSLLTGRAVHIRGIRREDPDPGVRDYEVSFMELIGKVTDGTNFKLSRTGTGVRCEPGVIIGGEVGHVCPGIRGIGYFLEPLLALGPFSKRGFAVTLEGATSNDLDISADTVREALLPILRKFSAQLSGASLSITRRGVEHHGGGSVIFRCPAVEFLRPADLVEPGKVSKIRGVASAVNLPRSIPLEAANAARAALTEYTRDVYVAVDCSRNDARESRGYAVTLQAHSTCGAVLSADLAAASSRPERPAKLGERVAQLLLKRIKEGGGVDPEGQRLAITLSAFTTQGISSFVVGRVTDSAMDHLRDLHLFTGTKAKIDAGGAGGKSFTVTLAGANYYNRNLTRK